MSDPLHDHMYFAHDLILLEDDLRQIRKIVARELGFTEEQILEI